MARRIERSVRISPLHAQIGPLSSSATRMFGAERAIEIKAEHAAWNAERIERWEAGNPEAPPPPYADVLDHFARPG